MRRFVGSAAVISFLLGGWACSSFSSATEPTTADAGPGPDADMTPDRGNSDPDFLVPLGTTGCKTVPSAKFCADFSGSDPTAGWKSSKTNGSATLALRTEDGAPSAPNYVEFTMDPADAGSCAYDSLGTTKSGLGFRRATFQFGVRIDGVRATMQTEAVNVAILGFSDGDKGETFYLNITTEQLVIHEQYSGVDGGMDHWDSFPKDVTRQSWIYVDEILDLDAQTFTLKVKDRPGDDLVLPLGKAVGTTGSTLSFGIGYSCSDFGADIGFDDVVVTYQ